MKEVDRVIGTIKTLAAALAFVGLAIAWTYAGRVPATPAKIHMGHYQLVANGTDVYDTIETSIRWDTSCAFVDLDYALPLGGGLDADSFYFDSWVTLTAFRIHATTSRTHGVIYSVGQMPDTT